MSSLPIPSILHLTRTRFFCACIIAVASCLVVAALAMAEDTHGQFDGGPSPLASTQALFAGYNEDRVGTAVSLSGDLLAVGVPNADLGIAIDSGRVDIYRWINELGRWMKTMEIAQGTFGWTSTTNARFGAAVSASAGWLLIGCPGCPPADAAKAVLVQIPDEINGIDGEVSEAASGSLTWYHATPPNLGEFSDPVEGTGSAVALNVVTLTLGGEQSIVVAIGSPAAAFGATELGAIAMGKLDGNQVIWEYGPTYGNVEFGKFGKSLAMTSTRIDGLLFSYNRYLVVGHPSHVESGQVGAQGRAVLWQRAGGSWSSVQAFTSPDPGFLDSFGSAVAIERGSTVSLGTIAIGAPGRSYLGTPGGSVRIYRQETANGAYLFEREVQHANAVPADRFGGSLALNNGYLLVGADGRAVGNSANAGSAYLHRRALLIGQPIWPLQQVLVEPDSNGGNAAFGSSVAIGRHVAAIGAPLSDAANLANAGTVVTYLCDHVFGDGIEGESSNACAGP